MLSFDFRINFIALNIPKISYKNITSLTMHHFINLAKTSLSYHFLYCIKISNIFFRINPHKHCLFNSPLFFCLLHLWLWFLFFVFLPTLIILWICCFLFWSLLFNFFFLILFLDFAVIIQIYDVSHIFWLLIFSQFFRQVS